jgi:hypothetical protein
MACQVCLSNIVEYQGDVRAKQDILRKAIAIMQKVASTTFTLFALTVYFSA